MSRSVYIGFDPREAAAFAVARHSIEVHLNTTRPDDHMPIMGIDLAHLRSAGIYRRPTEIRDGRLWDVISGAPMATEFAVSRFLVKALNRTGWALFMDCDMLVRADLNQLFDLCDPSKAVMCVKHEHLPAEGTKMDGQVQTAYPRKNWSSVFALNCDHPANKALTIELVNSVPGRDLHRFCWLADDDIGALPVEWNWLAGHSDPAIKPKIVHHTEGSPCLPGYENAPFADEWHAALREWARGS